MIDYYVIVLFGIAVVAVILYVIFSSILSEDYAGRKI